MKATPKELIFISKIEADGSKVTPVTPEKQEWIESYKDLYTLQSLSLTNKTFIACHMNCYVVKLKE